MHKLFSPAVSVLNRVGYTQKFAIMGALALVAIMVLMVNLYQSLHRVIDSSQQELAGLEVIKPIARLVQHLQIHRGLSSEQGIGVAAEKVSALVNQDILTGTFATPPGEYFARGQQFSFQTHARRLLA